MFKVSNRNGSIFGNEPYICEFVCDTTSDVPTLPTSISEGTGGKTKYDNQLCSSGSIATVIDNGSDPKKYILNNQNTWCPYSVSEGSSSGGSSISITVDSSLSDSSKNPVENKVVTAAINNKADISHTHSANEVGADAEGSAASALASSKEYTDSEIAGLINGAPTTLDTLKEIADAMAENQTVVEALNTAIGSKADKTDIPTKVSELENDSGYLTEHQDLSNYAAKTDIPTKVSELENDSGYLANQDLSEYALKSLYGDTTINVGRKGGTNVGGNSTAEGYQTTASGIYSHTEGDGTSATRSCSHAEGSHTTASGDYSHAEGIYTIATNEASHAGGHYNANMTTGGYWFNTTGTAFVIGNGTDKTALSNAFSVQYDGIVKAKSTITASTTADYAEFFEWIDGNPDNDDRIGYFVTLDGDKIRIATAEDDYILGVVSGEPFVLGNGDCDTWNGMFLRDEFRRTIYEPAPKIVEVLDSEGNPTGEFEEVEGEFEGTRPKLNPEYDHTQPYISRFDRKEWAPVGMLGVLSVRHDGTAQINGYVTVNADGIATACDKNAENSYRVIKSNSDTVVEIIFR